jgi:hypothetical protein
MQIPGRGGVYERGTNRLAGPVASSRRSTMLLRGVQRTHREKRNKYILLAGCSLVRSVFAQTNRFRPTLASQRGAHAHTQTAS